MSLQEAKCVACEAGVRPLSLDEAQELLQKIVGWEITTDSKKIKKVFSFKNYYQTMAFVNATAWISHRENHHPDLEVRFNQCVVEYTTHAIDGLSKNDFICAAKIDTLSA